MTNSPDAPAPAPISLSGSKPGVFDPTQPARLLRYPDSTLLFASFNPFTGGGPSLSADALTRARRIVIEVSRANDERPNCFSFVPNAVLAPGVASEGHWPKVVNYCGWWAVCDQDQWDIHKLDPAYDCFIPSAGMSPTITKKISLQFPAGGAHACPGKRELPSEGDRPPPFCASEKAREGAAPYPVPGHGGPRVPVGEATSAASATFTVDPASGVPFQFTLIPPTAYSAAPPSSTRSSGQLRPRTPDFVDLTMDEDDKDIVDQARVMEVARLELERGQRRQKHRQQWMPWTRQRALDRYLAVSEQFDSARFSHENPVDLLFIPWPVLHSPFTLRVDQVDWQMVEAFFEEAARRMKLEDYRVFVAESHRRFHPDRWSCRGVFRTYDNELAEVLHRACTIVSQALTPIWAASKAM